MWSLLDHEPICPDASKTAQRRHYDYNTMSHLCAKMFFEGTPPMYNESFKTLELVSAGITNIQSAPDYGGDLANCN